MKSETRHNAKSSPRGTSLGADWLKHGTLVPRPSYLSVLLWKHLMGNTVYNAGETRREVAQVYALTGKELVLGENDELPEMSGVTMEGTIQVAPGGCTFIVL